MSIRSLHIILNEISEEGLKILIFCLHNRHFVIVVYIPLVLSSYKPGNVQKSTNYHNRYEL